MSLRISGSSFNFLPGAPCFIVSSNFFDEFEIGDRFSTKYWLLAEIVGPPAEFIFNGRIFVPGISEAGTVIDNFPRGPTPRGWIKRPRIGGDGFELYSADSGELLFGYEVRQNRCLVTTNLYDENGHLVAETLGGDFVVHRPPCRLGRGGIVML